MAATSPYRAQQRPGFEADRFRLMLYDRKTGEKTVRTEKIDQWIGTYIWSPDSKYIFYSAESQGPALRCMFWEFTRKLGRKAWRQIKFHPVASGSWEGERGILPRIRRRSFCYPRRKKRSFFTNMSLQSPSEIFTCDLKQAISWGDVRSFCKSVALTHVNQTVLAQIYRPRLESFWFAGAHNDRVEGFMVKPPNFDPARSIR